MWVPLIPHNVNLTVVLHPPKRWENCVSHLCTHILKQIYSLTALYALSSLSAPTLSSSRGTALLE